MGRFVTEEQRYLFDLRGYLVIEGAIPPHDLAEMNAYCDEMAARDPRWAGTLGNDKVDGSILTWGPAFRRLLTNQAVLPFLQEVCGVRLRLDHDYAIFLSPGGPGLRLHGGGAPYDPAQSYTAGNGRLYSALTVAAFALGDVEEGAGGFACIAGSHKSALPCPRPILRFEQPSPIVEQVPVRAGDCIVFTEALTHGTLPWNGPGVRRTLFLKFCPHYMAWSSHRYEAAGRLEEADAILAEASPEERELLRPPHCEPPPPRANP